MYETKEDLQREYEIADFLKGAWACDDMRKNPCPPYKIDWSFIRDNKIVAMVEIKTAPKKYPNYRLALHKYTALRQNSSLGIPTIIAIKIGRRIYYSDVSVLSPVECVWWEDGRQRDVTDNEPAMVFSWDQFKTIDTPF